MKKNILAVAVLVAMAASANANAGAYANLGTASEGKGEFNAGFTLSDQVSIEFTASKVALKPAGQLMSASPMKALGAPAVAVPVAVGGPIGGPVVAPVVAPVAPTAPIGQLSNFVAPNLQNKLGVAIVVKTDPYSLGSGSIRGVFKGGLQGFHKDDGTGATATFGGMFGKVATQTGIEPVASIGFDYHIVGNSGAMVTARLTAAPDQVTQMSIGLGYSF